MSISREQWLAARRRAADAEGRRSRPPPTAASCELRSRTDGNFDVVIRGEQLRSGAVAPEIRIGERPVRQVRGQQAGTELVGVVEAGAVGDTVTVDLGPAGTTETSVGAVR